jgi:predicted nucleic acid-binding Zn ribbon protein
MKEEEYRPRRETLRPIKLPIMSAMTVDVRYCARRVVITCEERGGHTIFHTAVVVKRYETRPIDCYDLRDKFDSVTSPTEAKDFLSHAGELWTPITPFTWIQFRFWQQLMRLTREHGYRELKRDEGKNLGSQANKEVLRDPPDDPEWRLVNEDIKAMRKPYTKHWVLSVDWVPSYGKRKEQMEPVLYITAHSIVDAIVATYYAEAIAGVIFEKCDACGERFELRSRRGQKYCSDACKETARKRRKRDAEFEAVQFLLSKLAARGRVRKKVIEEARSAGISITSRAISRAGVISQASKRGEVWRLQTRKLPTNRALRTSRQ